ncbi:extensin, partial [Pseudomonas aeruginosa]|nr:extensin [Pseudomonas aeruginosa]MBF3348500.1 extensin [Pseudomonas aeruginosa]
DWAGESADGRFLRRVRDGACASFNAVLGPDYNAAHRDHFHLDMGLWKVCR